MSLTLLMDVHVPKVITDGIRRCGVDARTAQEVGAATDSDESLLERAADLNCLLFTQDADFLQIAARWQTQGKHFPGIVFGHQLNCSIGQTIEDLELVCKCAITSEVDSQVTYLPLSK